MTKNQLRTALFSAAAVTFSAGAALEPPLQNLTNLARAGTSFSAKQLCSGVLMAGMDPNRMLREDLASGQGLIQTRIDPGLGALKPAPCSDCSALKPFRTENGAAPGG